MHKFILAFVASACVLGLGACATVDLISAPKDTAYADVVTPAQLAFREEVSVFTAQAKDAGWIEPDRNMAAKRAVSVLLHGWGNAKERDAEAFSDPLARYAGEDGVGAAQLSQDAQDARACVIKVNAAAEAVLAAPGVAAQSLLADVTAMEEAISAARQAHGVLSDAFDQTDTPLSGAYALNDVLDGLERETERMSALANALNARRMASGVIS